MNDEKDLLNQEENKEVVQTTNEQQAPVVEEVKTEATPEVEQQEVVEAAPAIEEDVEKVEEAASDIAEAKEEVQEALETIQEQEVVSQEDEQAIEAVEHVSEAIEEATVIAESASELLNEISENVEVKDVVAEEAADELVEEKVIYSAEEPSVNGKTPQLTEEFAPGKWNPFEVKVSKFAFKKDTTFETRLLQVKRVIKVTKGGRRFKFFALVVVGDKNGRVGFASAKDIEIPNAISKAERLAKKNLYKVKIIGSNKTVSHDILSKHGSAKVLLKPAAEGKGIIASNNIRAVVELAGYHNIYSKNLGTSNPKNVVIATINALIGMKTKEEISNLRGKEI